MKFGVREICDVVFKALQKVKIGDLTFEKGQPVLYIDTAKTSTIEGAATTVYATGGRGNARLIAWEGEKTLTFTVEDALLSPIGFAVLSGAGLFNLDNHKTAMVHCTAVGQLDTEGSLEVDEPISDKAPIFVTSLEQGSIGAKLTATIEAGADGKNRIVTVAGHTGQVFVDYYTERETGVTEIQIDAGNFAGFYYVEASTLFRREEDGKDMPAEIVFPRVKIQSNFTFNMAATGDPSTFTFTMDAFPAYTMFDKKKKVLCAIQVVADDEQHVYDNPVTRLEEGYAVDAEIMDADSKE